MLLGIRNGGISEYSQTMQSSQPIPSEGVEAVLFYSYRAETVLYVRIWRPYVQNRTSTDVRFWRIKPVPAL